MMEDFVRLLKKNNIKNLGRSIISYTNVIKLDCMKLG